MLGAGETVRKSALSSSAQVAMLGSKNFRRSHALGVHTKPLKDCPVGFVEKENTEQKISRVRRQRKSVDVGQRFHTKLERNGVVRGLDLPSVLVGIGLFVEFVGKKLRTTQGLFGTL